MSVESRLQKLERIAAKKPPFYLFGQYYDELTESNRVRYMRYVYGSDYKSLKHCEKLESQVQGTLHFVCSSKEIDINLDSDFFAVLTRTLELN